MQEARMLGNYVAYLADRKGLSIGDLGNVLGCSENQVYAFLKGRGFASFSQISRLAGLFGCSVAEILAGDEKVYHSAVVETVGDFRCVSNREFVLDLIDDFVDLCDAIIVGKIVVA